MKSEDSRRAFEECTHRSVLRNALFDSNLGDHHWWTLSSHRLDELVNELTIEYVGGVIACVGLAHMVGDYLIQSDWMAEVKLGKWSTAILHAVTYGLPFIAITRSPLALFVIVATHALIDRYRLAKHWNWFKNQLAPKEYRPPHTATGHSEEKPPFLAVWLLIITDNIWHVLINIAAVVWL